MVTFGQTVNALPLSRRRSRLAGAAKAESYFRILSPAQLASYFEVNLVFHLPRAKCSRPPISGRGQYLSSCCSFFICPGETRASFF